MARFNAKQLSVRQINAHVIARTGGCYVETREGKRFRISRVRTRRRVVEGRVVCGDGYEPLDWAVIPADATIELL